MADYSFTLVDADDAALTAHVARVNAERRAKGLPALPSNQAFVDVMLRELIAPVRERFDTEDAEAVINAYKRATLAARAAVKTELGVS